MERGKSHSKRAYFDEVVPICCRDAVFTALNALQALWSSHEIAVCPSVCQTWIARKAKRRGHILIRHERSFILVL